MRPGLKSLPPDARAITAICRIAAAHVIVAVILFALLATSSPIRDLFQAVTAPVGDMIPHLARTHDFLLANDRADEWPLVMSSFVLSLALALIVLPVYVATWIRGWRAAKSSNPYSMSARQHVLALFLIAIAAVYYCVFWYGPVTMAHGSLAKGKSVEYFSYIVANPLSGALVLILIYLELRSLSGRGIRASS